jgi:hypothetical protein
VSWKLALQRLYETGTLESGDLHEDHATRATLTRYGLATMKRSGQVYVYTITERGKAVIQGQIEHVPAKHRAGKLGGWQWRRTWTAAILPRAI